MFLDYPYQAEINSVEEAVRYVKSQCDNCPKYRANFPCPASVTKECDRVVDLVVKIFREDSRVSLNV